MNRLFLIVLLCIGFTLPSFAQIQKGKASYYAEIFEGRKTASGELYAAKNLTGAHRSLPFGTLVKVVNLKNKKSVIVTINDRGPFIKGRIIDLSRSAALAIDCIKDGVVDVSVEVVEAPEK